MTWSPLRPNNFNETPKTRWRAVPWCAGKGLDLGCGKERLYDTEFVLGIDNGYGAERWGMAVQANIRGDARQLPFSPQTFDYVYSSFLLQSFPYKEVPDVLRHWFNVIKIGGTLVLYLPDEDQVPKVIEPERDIAPEPQHDPDQKWNVNYARVVQAMEKLAFNWDLCHMEKCSKDEEFALFFVWRRLK